MLDICISGIARNFVKGMLNSVYSMAICGQEGVGAGGECVPFVQSAKGFWNSTLK